MKVTVKEGWSKNSKLAIMAICVSVLVIVGAVMFD
jgi:hypothetical protein